MFLLTVLACEGTGVPGGAEGGSGGLLLSGGVILLNWQGRSVQLMMEIGVAVVKLQGQLRGS